MEKDICGQGQVYCLYQVCSRKCNHIDFIFVVATATIDFEETIINECFTVASESKNMSVRKGMLRNMSQLKTRAPGD